MFNWFLCITLSDEDTERTCADVMAVFDWISCEDDGSFSALQCNPDNRQCYCLLPDGARASNKVFRQDRVSADTCNQRKDVYTFKIHAYHAVATRGFIKYCSCNSVAISSQTQPLLLIPLSFLKILHGYS